MKKFVLFVCLIIFMTLLTGCGLRQWILRAPDEVEIPKGSLIAVCTSGENTYTHIYKNDGIYQYSINDVIQSEDVLGTIQEQAFLNGESVANYLNVTYPGACVIENYN